MMDNKNVDDKQLEYNTQLQSTTAGHDLSSEDCLTAFDTESTPMITPSEIIEHIYCPRFTYFMNCLEIPQHEELRYKVLKGRELHDKKEKTNVGYLRKKLGCIDRDVSVYIASREIGVRGVVDEVLHLQDGSLAPLDYKYTEYNAVSYTHLTLPTIYSV